MLVAEILGLSKVKFRLNSTCIKKLGQQIPSQNMNKTTTAGYMERTKENLRILATMIENGFIFGSRRTTEISELSAEVWETEQSDLMKSW